MINQKKVGRGSMLPQQQAAKVAAPSRHMVKLRHKWTGKVRWETPEAAEKLGSRWEEM